MTGVDWQQWSVVLLKPDCVQRSLCDQVLEEIDRHLTVVDRRRVTVAEHQIFAHYDDLLTTRRADFTWVDVEADLRDHYAGNHVGIALAHGNNAAIRLRDLLGHWNPAQASPSSIRGHWGTDSIEAAMAEARLVRNIIHSSDHPQGAGKEFAIWYGHANRHLLQPPLRR